MGILIIEDNVDLAKGLANNLEIDGLSVEIRHDGITGLAEARESRPDLVILDLMLPDLDGYRVLQTLREQGNDVPVLILTARSGDADKVRGFRYGCDDYVTKPFGLLELLGRVRALLRRAAAVRPMPSAVPDRIRFGDVEVVTTTHSVYRRGFLVVLRPKEYELLLALARRGGEVVSRADVLREVWGYQPDVVSRTLDTHIVELRRKLEDNPSQPRHILTVRKAGYRLRMD